MSSPMRSTRAITTATSQGPVASPLAKPALPVTPLWQVNVLRIGYLVVGVGLAIRKWPLLVTDHSWGLAEGTVVCMLVALSVLALLGLRHPLRMLPILLFEVAWKLTWLALIALPQWLNGTLDGATAAQAGDVLWVVVVLAVIPWRHVLTHYVTARGKSSRRDR